MSFDKVKAMRDAERFLAQGKLRAAISEYKRIVEADKTDFNTLNMLGDLYVKATETDEAVKCFTQVAEYYSKQGFAQKAIAIYNKISRLKPDLIEVSAKLAQLYQAKGSVAEARTHYTTVAEQYTKSGKKAEALFVWKQIANLDPNNTEIYLKIADACWQDQQKEEAANAYIEAGNRLSGKSQFESAITAFSRALEIRPDDLSALRGYVKSQIGLGYADEAAKSLESSLIRQPHSREIIGLLAECYLEAGKLLDAEKTIVKLVEQEPTNYSKLLDIFHAYLRAKDVDSASRMLTMASEHLLVGGKAIELEQKINDVLALNPDHLDGIRLLVRFFNWQRDEKGVKTAFERLAESAKINNAVEDEIYALTQLVMISPQNVYFPQRLHELNLANGSGYYQNPQTASNNGDVPTFESFKILTDEEESIPHIEEGVSEFNENLDEYLDENNEISDNFEQNMEAEGFAEVENQTISDEYRELTEFEKHGFQTEIEGIDFYVEQGFFDLAEKTLDEIESRFGIQPEIIDLREFLKSKTLNSEDQETSPIEENKTTQIEEESEISENLDVSETIEESELSEMSFPVADTVEIETETIVVEENIEVDEAIQEVSEIAQEFDEAVQEKIEPSQEIEVENYVQTDSNEAESEESSQALDESIHKTNPDESEKSEETVFEDVLSVSTVFPEEIQPSVSQSNPFDDLKSEFSSEESYQIDFAKVENDTTDDDFETSYQTGIVYREMGLIEDSIREFQDAIKLVNSQDGTRRFFLCCNMLGHCFMEKEMPTIAIMWFKQGLDSNHLSQYELNGMRYELAYAYEKAGDKQKAQQFFEEIYAVDVDFRDVGIRLNSLIAG